jgi:hypothetical protein
MPSVKRHNGKGDLEGNLFTKHGKNFLLIESGFI